MFDMKAAATHGGTDALGVPAHDFSTNRNACGPCPTAVRLLQAAHVAQYPDPHYTELREQLAAFHGVALQRIVMGASSSELIHRITLHAVRSGAKSVQFPQHHYGDYLQAARVWRLALQGRLEALAVPALSWACEPSSPLGRVEDIWPAWQQAPRPKEWRLLDCAYRPLWLEGDAPERAMDDLWQLWTPNKALGMTGVRAAYAIAPVHAAEADLQALNALAPSWVVGSHGVAMLQAWVTDEVQQWLQQSRGTLSRWKAQQLALCERLGWQVLPGHQANYFVAHVPVGDMSAALSALRKKGVKLRDCESFGLPGHVRLGVLPPVSQAALEQAWKPIRESIK